MTVRLIPLDCPSCGSALHAEPLDVLFLCDHCGTGAVLGDSGLKQIEATGLLPAPGRRAELWKPAWIVEAEVEVSGRVCADGRATEGWRGERTFVVPAFELAIGELTRLAAALGRVWGAVGEVPREPVTGGILRLEDAMTLVRHMVVGEEVQKPDLLARVEVTIEERSHRLSAIPFERHGDRLRCAVTGVEIAERAGWALRQHKRA